MIKKSRKNPSAFRGAMVGAIFTFSVCLLSGRAVLAEEYNPFEKQGQDDLAKLVDELVEKRMQELLEKRLSYGFGKSPVQVHAFINAALWWLGEQAYGSHADTGSSISGRPSFITYSGYIDVSADISRTLFAEAEFELYKGEKGEFKVTRLRGVWSPSKHFRVAIGRDFPPIGIQDYVYYPPSQYRLFTFAPYLYWAVLRATGWWDAGVHLSGSLPLTFLGLKDGWIKLDVSVINGPGEQHQSDDNYLLNKMVASKSGYMFEGFHDKARQPWDNNSNKAVPVRLTISPLKHLEVGGSWMECYYDDNDKYRARYIFGHLLYGGERLTIAAEYGQLQIQVDPANMMAEVNHKSGTYGDTWVTQRSYYFSAGYKIIKDWGIHFLEPVVRFEHMDSWVEDKTDKGDRYMVWGGFRISPIKYFVIKVSGGLQFEPHGPKLDNNAFLAETVYEF